MGSTTQTGQEVIASNDFTALLPKLAVTWHWHPDRMLYGSVSRAHRSGGFNGVSAPTDEYAYDEENSTHREIGIKTTWLDNCLVLNIASFYINITDEQIPQVNSENIQSCQTNAGESHRAEADFRYKPLPNWELIGGYGVLEAKYDKYEDKVAGIDYQGNDVIGSPKYNYNIGIQYRCPITRQWDIHGRIDFEKTGPRFWDDANTYELDPYEVVNIRLNVERDPFNITLWAKNLFDKEYLAFEKLGSGLAEDGPPLTLGLTIAARY